MNEEIDEDGVIVKGAKKIGKAVKGVFEKEPEKPKPFNVRLREKIKNIIGLFVVNFKFFSYFNISFSNYSIRSFS